MNAVVLLVVGVAIFSCWLHLLWRMAGKAVGTW